MWISKANSQISRQNIESPYTHDIRFSACSGTRCPRATTIDLLPIEEKKWPWNKLQAGSAFACAVWRTFREEKMPRRIGRSKDKRTIESRLMADNRRCCLHHFLTAQSFLFFRACKVAFYYTLHHDDCLRLCVWVKTKKKKNPNGILWTRTRNYEEIILK